MKDWLKKKLCVPENWDKYDYQTQRYSFDDIEEILQEYNKKQLTIHSVVVPKDTFCECEAPLIRTENNTNGYCGSCGKDLN